MPDRTPSRTPSDCWNSSSEWTPDELTIRLTGSGDIQVK
jgi:hypothetical protein